MHSDEYLADEPDDWIETTRPWSDPKVMALYLYAFLIPLLVIPVGGIKIAATDILAPFGLLLLVFDSRVQRRFLPLLLCTLAFLLLCGASLLANLGQLDEVTTIVLKYVRACALWFPFLLAITTPPHIIRECLPGLLKAIGLGGLLAAMLCLILFQQNIVFAENQQVNWQQTRQGEEIVYRAGALTGGSGSTGALIAMWAPLAALAVSSWGRFSRLVGYAVIALLTLAILKATSSRGGTLNLLVIISTFLALSSVGTSRSRNKLALIAIAGLFALTGGFMVELVMDGAISERINEFALRGRDLSAGVDKVASGRLDNWQTVIDVIKDRPFFGVGMKNGVNFTDDFVDNSYLMLSLECGLAATVLYVAILIQLIAKLVPLGRLWRYDEASVAAAIVAGVTVNGFFCEIYTFWASFPAAMMFAGCILSAAQDLLDEDHDDEFEDEELQ